MRKSIADLSEDQKAELKDVLNHDGMKVLEWWVAGRSVSRPIALISDKQNINSMEEVMRIRGQYEAYQDILLFLKNTREWLNTPPKEEKAERGE